MDFPQELSYARTHEWVRMTGALSAQIGLTDYAQHKLGDLLLVDLPKVGDSVVSGERFGHIRSASASSDLFSPVTGRICAVNEALGNPPSAINTDPYGAWLIEVEGITDHEILLSAEAYAAHAKKNG